MTQPHTPAHDGDSVRDAEMASAPSYPQRLTAQDHSATQEPPAVQDATREMPSVMMIPAPFVGTVPPTSAPAVPAAPDTPAVPVAPAPSAQEVPASDDTYSAPSGEPYGGHVAPASLDAFVSPTIIVMKKGPGWVAFLGAMFLTVGLTLGAVFYACPAMLHASIPINLNGGTVATVPVSNGSRTGWMDVATVVSPTVVTIQAQGVSSSGIGSGVVYDVQGDIVTNYHIIASVPGGGQIQVTFADGHLYSAVVIDYGKTIDLVVTRPEGLPLDLTAACLAASTDLEVGTPVMAIGAPLGLSNTVTTDIISALNRSVEVSVDGPATSEDGMQALSDLVVTNMIQIDAPINPGNSGGLLFDASGAVIGINSSIKPLPLSPDGQAGSIGLGFAIPSDLVVPVADQLIAFGGVSYGMLDVTVRAVTMTVGSNIYVGAEVQDISAGPGASAAGIRAGDVTAKAEGREVTSPKQPIGYVCRYRTGDTVTTTIMRDGATQDVSVWIQ